MPNWISRLHFAQQLECSQLHHYNHHNERTGAASSGTADIMSCGAFACNT